MSASFSPIPLEPPIIREIGFLISDYLITIIFLIELCIRFAAEKNVKDFFSDGWNIFDTIIVISSLIPSSASESILILRILRLLRLLRIVSFIPELRSMVENLFRSLAKSIYILILIFLIYVKILNFGFKLQVVQIKEFMKLLLKMDIIIQNN